MHNYCQIAIEHVRSHHWSSLWFLHLPHRHVAKQRTKRYEPRRGSPQLPLRAWNLRASSSDMTLPSKLLGVKTCLAQRVLCYAELPFEGPEVFPLVMGSSRLGQVPGRVFMVCLGTKPKPVRWAEPSRTPTPQRSGSSADPSADLEWWVHRRYSEYVLCKHYIYIYIISKKWIIYILYIHRSCIHITIYTCICLSIWDLVEVSSSKKWLKIVFTWGPAPYFLLLAHTAG